MSEFHSRMIKTAGSLVAALAMSSATAFAGQQPASIPDKAVSPGAFPTCSSFCAAINADGSIARAHNLTTSAHLGTGIYQVLFYTSVTAQKNLTKCVWLVTPGQNVFSGTVGPAYATTAGRAGTTNGVFIETFNGSGVSTDLPFLMEISC
jgi:hypothetical protein